jgi:hypothetical protein
MKTMLDVAQGWRWHAASAIVRGGDVTKPPECEAGRTLRACPANAVELLKEAVRAIQEQCPVLEVLDSCDQCGLGFEFPHGCLCHRIPAALKECEGK